MTSLDLRSLVIMSGIMGLMLSVVLFFLRMGYPRSIRGLGLWAAAPACVFLSTLFFAGRGVLPDFVSIVLANLTLLVGVIGFHAGAELFFGREPAWRWWALLLALITLPLTWYALVEPNYNARLIMMCLVWAGIFLAMASLIWRQGRPGFSKRFTVVVLLVHSMVLLLRFAASWWTLPDEGLLTATHVQTLYVGSNAIMVLALGVGLILMASDRLRGEFEHLASRDSLTQVFTRRVFLEACAQELARCRRHGRSMAVLLLDLDHFKAVNDTHGHQAGDRVLVDFAQRIADLLRRPDLLARFGGEEFVVLLPETTQEEAVAVAERILVRVAERVEGMPYITASIGLATNRPDEELVDTLLARADRALYKAKEEGRNRVAVA